MPVRPETSLSDGGVYLLQLLRDATRQQHAAIEHVIRLDASFTLQRYVATLQAFDSFLHAWEPVAASALPSRLQPWFWTRSRGALARRDLSWLSACPETDELCAEQVTVGSSAAAWGGMYVVEGSSLGGQVIAKTLQQQFGITVDNGGAFFGSRGANTAVLWREFCATMAEEVGEAPLACAQACQAATKTFEVLRALFTKTLARGEGESREPAES